MKKLYCIFVLVMLAWVSVQAQQKKEAKLAWGRNNPVGTGVGIHPARVAWAHAPGVAQWEKGNGRWYEDRWNDQESADWLVDNAMMTLTGEATAAQAWNALFTDFNQQHGKGRKGYCKGERIAVKLNMNNSEGYQDNEQINASPFLTLSLLRSMVNEAKIPQECITLFDASRFITDALFLKCHREFPRVHYIDNEGTEGREKAEYVKDAIHYSADNGRLATGLARCAVDADYLINMALLKGHGGQGVTLCAKNWYGATDIDRVWCKNQHNHFNQDRSGRPTYMTFTDYMAHGDLGGKTMLFLIDGTYGSKDVNGAPSGKWNMPPFNGSWPCSLFASQDGVAIDAVALDFLVSEFPTMPDVDYCDMYLVEAATADGPLSGTVYAPDGKGRVNRSLGMLEHWNNATNKQYKGIDLVYVKKDMHQPVQNDKGTDMGQFRPTDKPNTPMGIARGIYPGRVAWAYDPLAAAWDGKHGLYSDADNNSQTRVNDMLAGVIISLTNQTRLDAAWQDLFCTFNQQKGKGYTGYQQGEKIAVKVNLNDNGGTNIIDATPQSVCALLHQLVDIVGVPQHCITVYDAQRRGISAIYTYVSPLYPEVNYQNWGGFVPDVIRYSAEITDAGARSLARAAYEADYMINMALMKRHSQPTDQWKDSAGQTGITCTGKNQFGSIGNVPPLHFSIRDWSHARGMGTYNSIVDLMAHERVGGNTLVYLVDAMYVNPKHNGKAVRYQRAPFNDGWTSSFFASNDQVAIESVILDFIHSELPLAANADNFLHEAANIGNPPSGTDYVGKELGSLGVHEHWNNPTDRMYSRNLGTGNGIELYRVPLDANRPAIEYFYADQNYMVPGDTVCLHWKTSHAHQVLLNGKPVAATDSLRIPVQTTTAYMLSVGDSDIRQQLVIHAVERVADVAATDGVLTGGFLKEDSYIILDGNKQKEASTATWTMAVPVQGTYYLAMRYEGSSPEPALIFINGEKVTENYGFLSTDGLATGGYFFPVRLQKGLSTITMQLLGRRSNKIYNVSIYRKR